MGQMAHASSPVATGAVSKALANASTLNIKDIQQYLTFQLGGEMYAIGILNVKEIIEYGQLTEIPMMPAFIRGVINLRGSVVPVIDLSARFGGKQSAIGRRTCIVNIELETDDGKHDIGVVVDAVSEVLEVSPANIEPPPAFGAKIRADFIDGMAKIADKFVIILNIQRIISVDEISSLAALKINSQDEASAD
jgi:purine-binding chemotaxis protein CheW